MDAQSGLFAGRPERRRERCERAVDELERDLRETGEKEIPAAVIGEKIMAKLHELDDVAYVRFASVYREFKDVNDFVAELKLLLSNGSDER